MQNLRIKLFSLKINVHFKYKERETENTYMDIKNCIFIKFDAIFYRINFI
jgi:hypothetical protein